MAARSDARAIAQVHVAAWQRGYAGLLPDPYLASLSVEESEQRWDAALDGDDALRGSVRYLVAQNEDSRVVAVCAVGAPRDDEPVDVGELRMINVHPDSWGTGVARMLLVQAESELSELGFDRAYLWVLEGNERAQRFYRREGWTPSGVWKTDNRLPEPIREELYRRTLTAPHDAGPRGLRPWKRRSA